MKDSKAIIIVKNRDALRVAASSGRISTQPGTAMEIFDKSEGGAKDLNLIGKVLSSGHKSVIEHQTLSIAFNNVSVMVEQFVIEYRLAAYTVKSRRYVDFANAGFVVPEHLEGAAREQYCARMEACFDAYQKLMDLGVPKEDARFVLPYCLRSNFYMTTDAREAINMIGSMVYGRGSRFAEIRSLGMQLKEQFDEMYPGVIESERARFEHFAPERLPEKVIAGNACIGDAELLSMPSDAKNTLETAMAFSGRFEEGGLTDENLRMLLTDVRPRELEMLNYVFKVKNISLACLTHFARHRIQSPLIPCVLRALADGNYVLPETVRAIPEAEAIYRKTFADQAEAAEKAIQLGVSSEDLGYYALSGHELDILMSVNARELLHFMKLRTCSRAQWEIRGVAWRMLALLREQTPEIFKAYGPSCALGKCPEGKMTCGKPVKGCW